MPASPSDKQIGYITQIANNQEERARFIANPVSAAKRAGVTLDPKFAMAARKELAVELGCPEQYMADSAKMNVWLHKTVLQKIAENGGDIPQELLD